MSSWVDTTGASNGKHLMQVVNTPVCARLQTGICTECVHTHVVSGLFGKMSLCKIFITLFFFFASEEKDCYTELNVQCVGFSGI